MTVAGGSANPDDDGTMKLEELRLHHHTLSSGLRLIAAELPGLHRAVIDARLHVGSRYESPDDNGISHFLEHMIYRGTRRHPSAHAQALAFEELGGTLVAATGADLGSMTIAVPPESFTRTVPLFCEVFRDPIFDGIEVEKGIVHEEILEDLDEKGAQVDADNLARALTFEDHSLGYPITGTLDHVARFDLSMLRAHHARTYTARRTVIAVAGPVRAETALECLTRGFDGLPPGEAAVITPPPPQSDTRWRYVRHSSSQTAVRVVFRAPGRRDPDEPATDLLLRTLDDGMATRLYHSVCDMKGLCYDVSACYEAFDDTGIVDIAAESAHERTAAVLGELLDVLRRLRDGGPTEAELEKAKTRHRWQLAESLDDPEEVAGFLAEAALTGTARTFAERQEQIAAVTRDQVRTAAERIFRASNLSAVGVGLLPRREQDRLERMVADFR